jgi:hypothetical protein
LLSCLPATYGWRNSKVKGTAALCIADCALAPNDVVPSFISRGATKPSGAGALYQRRKELLSKEFSSQFVIHCNCEVLLHAKLEHGTDYLTSPPKEGMLRIFIYRKIQRRTREPEASMRTTRPPKPSGVTVTLGLPHSNEQNIVINLTNVLEVHLIPSHLWFVLMFLIKIHYYS